MLIKHEECTIYKGLTGNDNYFREVEAASSSLVTPISESLQKHCKYGALETFFFY